MGQRFKVMTRRRLLARGFAALLAVAFARDVAARERVDLLLVMAVDVSRSIDPEEARLQRQGYLDAWRSPRVARAATSGEHGRIAIAYVEWAGAAFQKVVVPWRVIDHGEAALAFADELEEQPRESLNWTAVGAAIDFSTAVLEAAPFQATRRVIDVSGDGRTNQGRMSRVARDDAVAKGITVNGLPVMMDRPNFGRPPDRELDRYYEENVIGGPGAFMVVADTFANFGEAILSKLIREIAGLPGPVREPATRLAQVPDAQ
jgi:hypothetical protein